MNEWLLILVIVAVLIGSQFFIKKGRPSLAYLCVQVIGTILLMIFVWGFADKDRWPYQLLLTAIAISSVLRTFMAYRKGQLAKP